MSFVTAISRDRLKTNSSRTSHKTVNCFNFCLGMKRGDIVSVYSDIDGQCRKGMTKPFLGRKIFVGNGRAKMARTEIFCTDIAPRYSYDLGLAFYVIFLMQQFEAASNFCYLNVHTYSYCCSSYELG